MLIISIEQVEVFSQAAVRDFERRMVGHIRHVFAPEVASMGEEDVIDLVRYGIDRALAHGLEFECDVRRYIEIMALYGREFYTSPALAWVVEILDDAGLSGEEKMDIVEKRLLLDDLGGRGQET